MQSRRALAASALPALRSAMSAGRSSRLSSSVAKPSVASLRSSASAGSAAPLSTAAAAAFKFVSAPARNLNGARIPVTSIVSAMGKSSGRSISSKDSPEAAAATTATMGGTGGHGGLDPSLSSIAQRLQSLEQSLTSSASRSTVSVQAAQDELRQVRILLETHARVSALDREGLKKAAATTMTLNGLFLIYLFFVCTWMMMLLTDLSGHMHGIPVVRMIALPKLGAGGKGAEGGVDVSVEPDKGFTDANTVPEPHLATDSKLQ